MPFLDERGKILWNESRGRPLWHLEQGWRFRNEKYGENGAPEGVLKSAGGSAEITLLGAGLGETVL